MYFTDECHAVQQSRRGMANCGHNTNSSQFYKLLHQHRGSYYLRYFEYVLLMTTYEQVIIATFQQNVHTNLGVYLCKTYM